MTIAVVVIGLATVAGIGLLSTSGREWLNSLQPRVKPLEVRIEAVARGNLVRTVSSPGVVEPRTKVLVSAQVLAKVVALPFREGSVVKKGEVVVRLDGRDLAAALEAAQAGMRQQEAALKGAEAEAVQSGQNLERVKSLPQDYTRAEVERAESAFAQATARVMASRQGIEQAKATITRAQKDLENTTITSPIDGIVIKLNAEVGETVVLGTLNNASSVIMEIADLSDMMVRARVDEVNIAPIKGGQRAVVTTTAYRTQRLLGTVERVGLKKVVGSDMTMYFEVEIALVKPDGLTLGSGLTASTDIEVETFAQVLRVPSQAVQDRKLDDLPKDVREKSLVEPGKTVARVVFVVENGKVKVVPVKTGASDLTSTLIEKGLTEGQMVVVGPYRALTELKADQEVVEEGTKDARGNLVGRKAGESGGWGAK
ncbi:MAG: efflux RND transporter periplasmic adaptor subunit [Phycisphaerales bacterium]|nr:efflux RND transporter periplasmic adaptor subunit [Phycisphaerales bacterium]